MTSSRLASCCRTGGTGWLKAAPAPSARTASCPRLQQLRVDLELVYACQRVYSAAQTRQATWRLAAPQGTPKNEGSPLSTTRWDRLVISPDSRTKSLFDAVVVMCVLYNVIDTPLLVSFFPERRQVVV